MLRRQLYRRNPWGRRRRGKTKLKLGKNNIRKTHEEYCNELKEKGMSVEPVEEYRSADIKIVHRCLKCGNEWGAKPANILSGRGCPKCAGRHRTHEEFLKAVDGKLNPDVEIIGKYVNATTKIQCRCKVCGCEWGAYYANLIKGTGCLNCRNINTGNRCRTTKDGFLQKLDNTFNGKIILISEYNGASNAMTFQCVDCGYAWSYKTGAGIFSHKGCPYCTGGIRRTHEEYKAEVESFGKVVVIGTFISTHDTIKVKCTTCGNEWEANAGMFLSGSGCRLCAAQEAGIKYTKSHEQFVEEINNLSSSIKIIGKYQSARDNIECECGVCGKHWFPTPGHLLSGTGCPQCSSSNGEQEITRYLDSSKIEYKPQHKFKDLVGRNGHLLSYDFYVPAFNLLIEYQGEQHYHPIDYFGGDAAFHRQQERDAKKRNYAKMNNYNLLEIKYDEDIKTALDRAFSLESVETTGAAQ